MSDNLMCTSGKDVADTAHREDDPSKSDQQIGDKYRTFTPIAISTNEFNDVCYPVCPKAGKAVIVSNFMETFKTVNGCPSRLYAAEDCKNLEAALRRLGFEPLTNDRSMIHKNLTKANLKELYRRAAREDYRLEKNEYTCVLFIVMSYGKPGKFNCHPEQENSNPEPVEHKHLLEAFQPQHCPSLALKPKLFILQTIPEKMTYADGVKKKKDTTTHIIPRQADFLTYSSDSNCIDIDSGNIFVNSIVDVMNGLTVATDNSVEKIQMEKLLIEINKEYKKKGGADWKIPCVTSSLTKHLKLFGIKKK